MRRPLFLAATTALLLTLTGCGGGSGGDPKAAGALPFVNSTQATVQEYDGPWRPVFEDDFDGGTLDEGRWRTREQPATGRRQCAKPDASMVRVRDGQVVLGIDRARSPTEKCPYGVFKNAMIGTGEVTEPGFTARYGLFAARVKFQSGRGQHGSFWLQGSGPDAAEIDVAEYFGDDRPDGGITTLIHQTKEQGRLETVGGPRTQVPSILGKGNTPSNGWHVWSVEWSPKRYVFRLDDTVTLRTERNLSSVAQFMVLSLLTSDWELPALNTTKSTMKVDWVRVWQRRGPAR